MLTGGRIAAAIEVLADIETRHRPVADALADWSRSHRFAGSADRSAIGNLVYDALRAKRSIGWRMGSDTPRALVLGTFGLGWGHDVERIDIVLAGDRHAPEQLSDSERTALRGISQQTMPDDVAADVPDWVWPAFSAAFREAAVDEGRALAQRAPLDLRVNTLKADRQRVQKALARFHPAETPLSPIGLRIVPPGDGRLPNIQAEASFQKGWFEIQDEGSQLCALACGAGPGMQVADICAGGGGKTLALVAQMQNKGQLHAYDADRHRLKGIFERLKRAGTRNVQVLQAGAEDELSSLNGRMDIVVVDAPCTGSGVWRRRPDAKWRLTPQALSARLEDQRAILDRAAALVRPGGRIVYITCSLLEEENQAQIDAFLNRNNVFATAPLDFPFAGLSSRKLTPARDNCDGFFIAAVERRG